MPNSTQFSSQHFPSSSSYPSTAAPHSPSTSTLATRSGSRQRTTRSYCLDWLAWVTCGLVTPSGDWDNSRKDVIIPKFHLFAKEFKSAPYEPDTELLQFRRLNFEIRSEDNKWGQGITENDLTSPNTLMRVLHTPDGSERMREAKRESWSKKADFLLSVIGFSVDLSNVWRFPNLVYKNGGGAFLIPYTLMLIFGGMPLFYMELALGQYNKKGAITCWGRICPLFKGIGYAVIIVAFYVDLYYNVVIAWSLYYLFASFASTLPWTLCNNTWNTPNCTYSDAEGSKSNKSGNSPAEEYFYNGVLQVNQSPGITELGSIRWQMAVSIFMVFVICYFALWKGVATSGKVVWFTAVYPYIVIAILLIESINLPGSIIGVKFYFIPQWHKLQEPGVWLDAAAQVFFSLGPGFGVLLAYASYNKFNNNVYVDAIVTSSISYFTSVLSGLVIFCILGYMSFITNRPINDVVKDGPGLVFAVYPEAVAKLPASTFWALIFFLMLLTLGLDSSFGGSEAIITALSDEFPKLRHNREIFVAGLFTFYFLFDLMLATQGGAYIVELMDRYSAEYSILFAVFCESIAVSWFYGIEQFCRDIEEMIGQRPGIFWRICWRFVSPVFIFSILVMGLLRYEPLTYMDYVYPDWANALGMLMAASSAMCIPTCAVYKLCIARGTFIERWKTATTPWRSQQLQNRPKKGTMKVLDQEVRLTGIKSKPTVAELAEEEGKVGGKKWGWKKCKGKDKKGQKKGETKKSAVSPV